MSGGMSFWLSVRRKRCEERSMRRRRTGRGVPPEREKEKERERERERARDSESATSRETVKTQRN